MRNLNSLSFADSCYEGENCHQAGDEGKEKGVEKERGGKREKKKGEGKGEMARPSMMI